MTDRIGTRRVIGTMSAEMLELEIGNRYRFTGINYGGHRTPGLTDGEFGMLPEPYRASAAEAVYVVFSYETPIGWEIEGGEWIIPNHFHSSTTSAQQNALRAAVTALGRNYSDGL